MNKKDISNRILILGNSGSGKSWLADQLSTRLAIKKYDLDDIHWQPGGYNLTRNKQVAIQIVQQAATKENWIIEGVYGWLAQEAIDRTTKLIWLDILVSECLENLEQRGLRRRGNENSCAALKDWTADYPNRKTSSSFFGHQKLFLTFPGPKIQLCSRKDISRFLVKFART